MLFMARSLALYSPIVKQQRFALGSHNFKSPVFVDEISLIKVSQRSHRSDIFGIEGNMNLLVPREIRREGEREVYNERTLLLRYGKREELFVVCRECNFSDILPLNREPVHKVKASR